MSKYIVSLFCVLIFGPQAFAQSDSVPQAGLLWEISGNGLESSSFLFGTMHVMSEDSFFIPPGFGYAIARSQQLVLEVNPEEDGANFLSQFDLLIPPEDSMIVHFLTDEEYEEVEAFMAEYGQIPAFIWEKMYPILIQQMIPPGQCPDYLAFQGKTFSYEGYLMDIFAKLDRPLGALETVSGQLDMFIGIPMNTQVQQLLLNVRGGTEDCGELKALVGAYRLQDLSTLEQILLKSTSLGAVVDQFLYQRNQHWIPVIESNMAEMPSFFAVGAGHLPGEQGVIMLLRAEGYEVTRVR